MYPQSVIPLIVAHPRETYTYLYLRGSVNMQYLITPALFKIPALFITVKTGNNPMSTNPMTHQIAA